MILLFFLVFHFETTFTPSWRPLILPGTVRGMNRDDTRNTVKSVLVQCGEKHRRGQRRRRRRRRRQEEEPDAWLRHSAGDDDLRATPRRRLRRRRRSGRRRYRHKAAEKRTILHRTGAAKNGSEPRILDKTMARNNFLYCQPTPMHFVAPCTQYLKVSEIGKGKARWQCRTSFTFNSTWNALTKKCPGK